MVVVLLRATQCLVGGYDSVMRQYRSRNVKLRELDPKQGWGSDEVRWLMEGQWFLCGDGHAIQECWGVQQTRRVMELRG